MKCLISSTGEVSTLKILRKERFAVREIITTTREVENMVRKAEELRSLDELNLSTRTRNYLKKHFDSIDEIVMEGRVDTYEMSRGIQLTDKAPKWKLELVSALKDMGFIRPAEDFVMSFNIASLYAVVPFLGWRIYPDYNSEFITSIGQLSNVQYEAFRSLTEEEIEEVKSCIGQRLTAKESEVIYYRFGFNGDSIRDLESVSRHLNVTRERVRQIEMKAIRKLMHPITKLPAVFDATDKMNKNAEKLNDELEELYKSPAFVRANEITQELEYMKRLPFKYTCKCFVFGTTDQTPIDDLGLSARAYNCIRRANIYTVADIINLPKENWFKIRNLGRHGLEEVIEKMHSIGYEDFNVE